MSVNLLSENQLQEVEALYRDSPWNWEWRAVATVRDRERVIRLLMQECDDAKASVARLTHERDAAIQERDAARTPPLEMAQGEFDRHRLNILAHQVARHERVLRSLGPTATSIRKVLDEGTMLEVGT